MFAKIEAEKRPWVVSTKAPETGAVELWGEKNRDELLDG